MHLENRDPIQYQHLLGKLDTQFNVDNCKSCRAEANMKTEIRKKGSAGSMEAWSCAQYAGETEREKHQNTLFPK